MQLTKQMSKTVVTIDELTQKYNSNQSID